MECKPKVSVLLLVDRYTDSKEGIISLSRCIDSLVYQTLEEIEILVLLHKDRKQYRSMVSIYCNKFGEKIRICDCKDQDLIEDIKSGLKITTGEYISILSEDVVLEYHAYATLYREVENENTLDFIYGGYKYYENGTLLGCKDKRLTEEISHSYILKGELILFNKIFRRSKIEEFIQLESESYERNYTDKNTWNEYGLSIRIISSCKDNRSCNTVLFHQILNKSSIKYKNSKAYLEATVEGIEKTLQWSENMIVNTLLINKSEYLYARIGLELVRLMQSFWLYSNRILPLLKKYKNSITQNTVFETYTTSFAMFERLSNLTVDAIPRILYVGEFEQDFIQEESKELEEVCFKEFGEVHILNALTCDISSNSVIEKAYKEGRVQFVEEYFAVESLVKTGGFYIGKNTQLQDVLDGLSCFESVIGFEDRTSIATGFLAARKGHKVWKSILGSYGEENFEHFGYESLSNRIRMYLIGMEEFHLNGKAGLLKSGILMLSPEQCIIPRYQELQSEVRPSICIMNQKEKAADEEYIVVKKTTLEYLLSSSNDARAMNKLKSNNAQLKKTLNKLLSSRSIRLTKPLRAGYQKIKNLSHVLRG
jgi:hypothetical protein